MQQQRIRTRPRLLWAGFVFRTETEAIAKLKSNHDPTVNAIETENEMEDESHSGIDAIGVGNGGS